MLCRFWFCPFSSMFGSRSSQNRRSAPIEERFFSLLLYGETLKGVYLMRMV